MGIVDAFNEVWLLEHAVVGDRRGDHRHLQHGGLRACRACVLAYRLAACRPRGFPRGHLVGVGHEACRGGDVGVNGAAEAELLRGFHEQVAADFLTELAECCIRRNGESLGERDGAIANVVGVGD